VAVFEPAGGSALSAAPGGRSGTKQARPSDQVRIGGQRSSSMWGRERAAETLGFRRGSGMLTAAQLDGGEGVGDGGGGFWWLRLGDGEGGAAPHGGAVEMLQMLRLGLMRSSGSLGPSQNGERG
jgi:hypothetical protein